MDELFMLEELEGVDQGGAADAQVVARDVVAERLERRNLFVHNDGVVNAQYLNVCQSVGVDCSGTKKGIALGVPQKYFLRAHETLYELAAKLSHVLWRKLSPEDRERADAHFAGTLIYDLLYEKRYRLARTLAKRSYATILAQR